MGSEDLQLLVETLKFDRRVVNTEPFKSLVCAYIISRRDDILTFTRCHVVKETMPGPECKTDDDLRNHVKDSLCTTFRTCSPSTTKDYCLMIDLRYFEHAEHASSRVEWCHGLELARLRDEEYPSH